MIDPERLPLEHYEELVQYWSERHEVAITGVKFAKKQLDHAKRALEIQTWVQNNEQPGNPGDTAE